MGPKADLQMLDAFPENFCHSKTDKLQAVQAELYTTSCWVKMSLEITKKHLPWDKVCIGGLKTPMGFSGDSEVEAHVHNI
jgi:hypothetical protein